MRVAVRALLLLATMCGGAAAACIFDIRHFGAVNGSDATAAVVRAYQHACAAAAAGRPHCIVSIPSGIHYIGALNTSIDIYVCDGVAIVGDAMQSSELRIAPGSKASAFQATCRDKGRLPCSLALRRMTIDLNSANTPSSAALSRQSGVVFTCESKVRPCTFQAAEVQVLNGRHFGIMLLTARGVVLNNSAAVITRCSFQDVRRAVWTQRWSNVAVTANSFNNVGDAVAVEGTSCDFHPGIAVTNATITGNTAAGVTQRTGFVVCSAVGAVVADNVVLHSKRWGFIVSMGCRDVAFRNNVVHRADGIGVTVDVTTGSRSGGDATIYPVNITLANNTVHKAGLHCFNTNHAEGVRYLGNLAAGATDAGFSLDNCRNVTLRGNSVTGCGVGIISYSSRLAPPNRDGYHVAVDNTFNNFACCSRAVSHPVIDFSRSVLPCCERDNAMGCNSSHCRFLSENSTFAC
jgi:parallel beta-helix repeat protein